MQNNYFQSDITVI